MNFVMIGGKAYRKGYTTGSCAAAAAKAAAYMLATGQMPEEIGIALPKGSEAVFAVEDCVLSATFCSCSVRKDGGDDPDVTTGLYIYAKAERSDKPGVAIEAGEGIGIVTKKGLKVPVGSPAINPVPLAMIRAEVEKVADFGVRITLTVPGGAEVAQKTYNSRLGVQGGISILGTTGVVVPMSEEAWKDALVEELSILRAAGHTTAAFVFGNYGEAFLRQTYGVEKDRTIIISNFVGFMLQNAVEKGFEKILLAGHMGKLAKVAAGNFHTHSRVSDARMETLCALAGVVGASTPLLQELYACTTTDAAAELLEANGLQQVYTMLVQSAEKRCTRHVFAKMEVGCILFNQTSTLLAVGEKAAAMLPELRGNGDA